MTVPCELTLRPTSEGVRLFAEPVAELASLRRKEHVKPPLTLQPGQADVVMAAGDLLEIHMDAEVADNGNLTMELRGVPIEYSAIKKTLTCGDASAPLALVGSLLRLDILLDRGSIEIFGNGGRVAISRRPSRRREARALARGSSGEPADHAQVVASVRAGIGVALIDEPRSRRSRSTVGEL